jgi:hypothetical protein
MTRTYLAVAVATLAVCVTTTAADAARKNTAASNLNSIRVECLKAQGAWYDAQTKRWFFRGADQTIQGVADAIHACVARKSGTKSAPFVKQERDYR